MLTLRSHCRLCAAPLTRELIHFDALPVAGAYVDAASTAPDPVHPLTLLQCTACGLVQLRQSVTPEFYSNYRFFTAATSGYVPHLESIAARLSGFGSVVEIGASDGTFLDLCRRQGLQVAGFEPAREAAARAQAKDLPIVPDFFSPATASLAGIHPAGAVVIRHVLEHIDDFAAIFAGIDRITNADSLLIAEVPDWTATVRERIYSNVYHIHPCYFDAATLARLLATYGWYPQRLEFPPVFGGSVLLYAARTQGDCRTPSTPPQDQQAFFHQWQETNRRTREFFESAAAQGKRVAGYGAAERTVSLIGAAGLDQRHVEAIYDRNPALIGMALPGSRIPIRHPHELHSHVPDLLALFARSFEHEIMREQAWLTASGARFVSLRQSPPLVLEECA